MGSTKKVQNFSPILFFSSITNTTLGKHVRHSYSPHINKTAMTPFTLVHFDIWVLVKLSRSFLIEKSFWCSLSFKLFGMEF